jgi:hypothetical protein
MALTKFKNNICVTKKISEVLRFIDLKLENFPSEKSSNIFLCLQCEQEVSLQKKCSYCQTAEFIVLDSLIARQYLSLQNKNDQIKIALNKVLDHNQK